jgi:formylglycine-generating enzyme required for sulfatase activity
MNQELQSFEFESVSLDKTGWIIKRSKAKARFFTIKLGNEAELEMIEIPNGSFTMGAPPNETDCRENEQPSHPVSVKTFFMGKFPITQGQWLAVTQQLPKMGDKFYGNDLPIVNVWLEKALEFCARLKQLTNLPFRVPSEAEWEYACRAGTTTPFNCGETITTEIANFNGNKPYNDTPKGEYRQQTTPVGYLKYANAFGLYDMHGNVWEWCADIWHEDYNGAPTDGSPWVTNGDHSYCVQRGGSWLDRAGACRSAFRVGDIAHNVDNTVGMRVCLSFGDKIS